MKEVTLIRHGEPCCDRRTRCFSNGFDQWLTEYDESGIKSLNYTEQVINTSTIYKYGNVRLFTSDLRRARETLKLLFPKCEDYEESSTYREITFPKVSIPLIKIEASSWLLLSRAYWLLGVLVPKSSFWTELERVKKIAKKIISCEREENIIIVAHGFFNLLLALHLKSFGLSGPIIPDSNYFAATTYVGAR